ncbi:hypothetical protein AAC387_Pa07g0394 [Persea americana]
MTLTEKKMLKKWKSDSAIQLAESCCSDILSDIEGFKKPVESASLRFRPNNLGKEKKEHLILQIEADAPHTEGVAAQNSCSSSRPSRECESGSGIMFYAVLIILVVAEVILLLHLVFF